VNYYELMVIFSSTLTEDEEKQQVLQVEELLKHEKANMHHIDHWGKRKLAYTIHKQRQGYYEWFYFELDANRIAEVERKLKMAEPILRFMVLRMEKSQIQNLQKDLERRKQASAPEPVAEAATTLEAPAAEEAQSPITAVSGEEVETAATETTDTTQES
jgi:small subunit ribosomal protein S6